MKNWCRNIWTKITLTIETAKEAGMKEKAMPTIIEAENASKSCNTAPNNQNLLEYYRQFSSVMKENGKSHVVQVTE